MIAVQDREKHNLPIYAYKVCKIFMQCEVTGGQFKTNIETTGFDYFGIDELPELAEEKNHRVYGFNSICSFSLLKNLMLRVSYEWY